MASSACGESSPDRTTINHVEIRPSSSQDTVGVVRSPVDDPKVKESLIGSDPAGITLEMMDDTALEKLAKMVVREIESKEWKNRLPINLDDFTGEKSPYLAEDAIVWLKKLKLAARQDEWNFSESLEVASLHMKGLAARWFSSIEKSMNKELPLDRDRWNYFQSQFEERFAGFRSRLVQVDTIKSIKLREDEDVREYAEEIMSMNSRLDEPLDDDFLRWVFIQGLVPFDLKDALEQHERDLPTLASAVKYARRYQLSQHVFQTGNIAPRNHHASIPPARSVRLK